MRFQIYESNRNASFSSTSNKHDIKFEIFKYIIDIGTFFMIRNNSFELIKCQFAGVTNIINYTN